MFNTDEKALFSSKAKAGLCSHTYIIDGESGIGKLDFAYFCAMAMLCTEKNKPCGYCDSCRKISQQGHPDVTVVGREKTASVDDVRRLIMKASLKPNDSDKQIFIICNAGRMREEAQNALLKIIEEPPETVAVFLLTESRSSLLPTVLSRGQRIHLDGMRDDDVAEVLREKYPQASQRMRSAAVAYASGNLGMAEHFLSKEATTLRAKAEKILSYALDKKPYELSSALLSPKYKREPLHDILSEALGICMTALQEKYGIEVISAVESQALNDRLAHASKRAVSQMSDSIFQCMISLEKNANVTIAASKLSLDLLTAATK